MHKHSAKIIDQGPIFSCVEGNGFADAVRIQMTKNRILMQRDDPEEMVGSIYLPGVNQERPLKGVVRAVGPEVQDVKVGDVLHYSARGRPEFMLGGVYHQVIVEADVFGVEE